MENKKAVLIIEDSLSMTQLYIGLLAAYKCVVHTASNADEAYKKMMCYDYDLYILDIVIDGENKGLELLGVGGADSNKCLIVSGNLSENIINTLVTFHKIPRNMIMNKPPDVQAFASILNQLFKENGDEENKKEDKEKCNKNIGSKILDWFKNLSFRGRLTLIGIIIVLPTTLQTTLTYFKYKNYINFNKNKVEYNLKKFNYFVKGDKITNNTFKENIINTDKAKYLIRIYPDKVIYIKVIPKDKNKETEVRWSVGKEYLETLGLKDDMTLTDIIKPVFK